MDNKTKVNCVALKISFLMQHQNILPDLKDIAMETYPLNIDPDKINYESPEYLMGACDALLKLISCLEQKG